MPDPAQEKVVYVLGAGFSADANLPLQRDILGRLIDLKIGDFPVNQVDQLLSCQKEITTFLRVGLDYSGGTIQRTRALEEIFTLLDQCIAEEINFGGLTTPRLMQVRDSFIRLILFLIFRTAEGMNPDVRAKYDAIARFFIRQRMASGKTGDPLAIISLNWDTVIEDSIFRTIRALRADRRIDVDYCFYTTPLDRSSIHTPSPKQKAKGIFNIKVLKLHGSGNWLRCPASNTVFTGLGMRGTSYELYLPRRVSPLVERYTSGNEKVNPPVLEPFIITPTFVKEFALPHIQTTWHNAFVELRECTKVVFLGYSMPEADYHFRTLLRRAVRPETEVEVVLTARDDLRRIPPEYHWTSATTRYRQFFGDGVRFHHRGVAKYFTKAFNGVTSDGMLRSCRYYLRPHKSH